jgi:uncharacterized protein (TIGR02598 family)
MLKLRGSQDGFSLMEVVIATGVLSVGLFGGIAVLAAGMQRISSSPNEVIAVQKAAEAIESVFSARDAQNLTWSQIRNVQGQSGSDGGVFRDAAQPLTLAGPDGVVNTNDDPADIEQMVLPNKTVTLNGFLRKIQIRDVADVPQGCGASGSPCAMRSVTVTITYPDGKATRSYTLTTFISRYS